MMTVTFYHSLICPRCRLAERSLRQLLPEFPDVQIERVEYLTHLGSARRAGVRSIPTLRCGDTVLRGFVLTKAGIRSFLESLLKARGPRALVSPART